MSLKLVNAQNNYVVLLLNKLKSTLWKIVEYSESISRRKNGHNSLLILFNAIITTYLKICARTFRTLYWLLAPNMLFKLAFRHIVLFSIMFATPSITRLTFRPFMKYIRYNIFLRIVMGKEWVSKYRKIKQQSCAPNITYQKYGELVSKLDEMDGLDAWRINKSSTLYSHHRIQQDLIELRKYNNNNTTNIRQLMQFLRSRIERNYCGITNTKLYSYTRLGTKKLIEDFIDNISQSLNYIAAETSSDVACDEKIVYFQELRHVIGRTALCLSGGGTLGAYHVGVVLAMHANNLLPKIITGSSVGSVVAALVCTLEDNQLTELTSEGVLNLRYFDRKQQRSWITGVYIRMRRFWQTKHFMDVTILRDCVRDNIGDITFLEAYQKTGRILNITVSGSDANTMPRLLNFLTAPNVVIWSAAVASCAIPFFFEAQELFVKNINIHTGKTQIEAIYLQGVTFSDGSVSHDLPMNKISQLFNVDNFIVSQVNPHLVPLLFHSIVAPIPLFERLFHFLGREFTLYATTVLINLRETGILRGFAVFNDLFTQKYTGDVTVVPDIPNGDYLRILSNPSLTYVQHCANISVKSTYKHIPRLQGLCVTEFTIDLCLKHLRSQLVNSGNNVQYNNDNTLSRVSSFQVPRERHKHKHMNRLHVANSQYILAENDINDMASVDTDGDNYMAHNVTQLMKSSSLTYITATPDQQENKKLHKSLSVAELCSDLSSTM